MTHTPINTRGLVSTISPVPDMMSSPVSEEALRLVSMDEHLSTLLRRRAGPTLIPHIKLGKVGEAHELIDDERCHRKWSKTDELRESEQDLFRPEQVKHRR